MNEQHDRKRADPPGSLGPVVRAPLARSDPRSFTEHGRLRTDPYHWLNRRDDPEVLAFLQASNDHATDVMRPTEALQASLLEELRALAPRHEAATPYRLDGFWYQARFEIGGDYPIFVRWRASPPGSPEERLLDANDLAAGHRYFVIEGIQISPGHDILACAVDTSGNRRFTLFFKDLRAGALLPDEIPDADSHFAWASDNRTVFYARVDPVTLRPYQVCRHALGAAPSEDEIVFEETDPAFRCLITKSRSQRYIFVTSFSGLSEDVRFLDADRPEGTFTVICPRSPGHEYEPDHCGQSFVLRTNLGGRNFRVCEAPVGGAPPETWREMVPCREDVLVERAVVFRDHLVLAERREALVHLRVVDRRSGEEHEIHFPEPAYAAWIEPNPDVDTDVVRLGYTSFVIPVTTYDYDMRLRRLTLVQREDAPGYDPDAFVTERRWAPARDGARVPISLVYRRDHLSRGPAPLLLFGYGAYGTNMPTYFEQSKLALLNRGFVYAMAHVRGGSELGRRWYREGRLLRKKNSFYDFIDCAEYLVREEIARCDALFAESLSAGGLVLGAVANMRPDLFRGVIAHVPFVDLLNTMTDPSLPLTASEYDEWGDPNRPDQWEYMRSYSPYDNVSPQAYPDMLVTASLHDSQVGFWEPAKWVARLREANSAGTQILLKTNMEAGHSGTSGRLRRLRDTAFVYAFLLHLAGLA